MVANYVNMFKTWMFCTSFPPGPKTQTDIFVSCYDLCSVLGVLQGEDTTVDVDDDEWDQTLCYCVNNIQELDCPNKINGEVSSGIKHELCNDSFYC